MGQLESAAKAHKAAQTALRQAQLAAKLRVQAARERADKTREDLAAAIVAAALQGEKQVEIIRITGYSRERVRTILREGGVEPD